jgi:hypothetical protein
MKSAKTLNWWVVGLGAWQILASLIFSYWAMSAAIWNAMIVGVLVIALALMAEQREDARFDEGIDWAIAALALWLVISPFVLGYSGILTMASWNDPIVGVLILGLSLRATTVLRREIIAQR